MFRVSLTQKYSVIFILAVTVWSLLFSAYASAFSLAKNNSIITVNPAALNKDVIAFVVKEKSNSVSHNKPNEHWSVESLKPSLNAITLKGSKLSIDMQFANHYPNAMRNMVNVTLKTESETRRLAFPVAMTLEKPVWVVRNYTLAKTDLRKSALQLEKRTITDDPSYYLGEEINPSQWMARINLIPGSILDRRQIEEKPVVFQNDQVHVLIHMAGGINITVQATALDNGSIGDRIRIKRWVNQQHASYSMATVTGQNSVEMDM